MNVPEDNIFIATTSQSDLFPRPNPRELPYMIDILKEMGKVTCEEEYSRWIQNLFHENKLSLALSEMILLSWLLDINKKSNWQPKSVCNICLEEVRVDHPSRIIRSTEDVTEIGYYVPSCPHLFCSPCLAQYLEMKLKEPVTTFPIKCPYHECDNTISNEVAQRVLDFDTVMIWWDKQAEAGISNKIYCPYANCAVPLENAALENGCTTIAECPVCNRAFCASCKTKWHPDMTCVENLSFTPEQKNILALLDTADLFHWSSCPSCKNIVEKNDGCNHMTCVCRCEFCYRCGNKWSKVVSGGCIAKCHNWSTKKLNEERKKNMPSLPALGGPTSEKLNQAYISKILSGNGMLEHNHGHRLTRKGIASDRLHRMFRR